MTHSKQEMVYNVLVRWRYNKRGLRGVMGATYNIYENFESLCVTRLYALTDFQGQCYCPHDVLLSTSGLQCHALTLRGNRFYLSKPFFFSWLLKFLLITIHCNHICIPHYHPHKHQHTSATLLLNIHTKMSTFNSSTGSKAPQSSTPATYTFDFCNNAEVKGMKKVVVQGQMRGLSPYKRAKLLSSEARVCIAYRDGKQLIVLEENVNSDILYHYCPQLRDFYSCCKEAGPTIVLPNTEKFSLVSALGVSWVVGSFIHEASEGTRSFYKDYIPSHSNPKQLFHAAAAFRALDLPRFAEDLVAREKGAIVRSLKHTCWSIKTPKAVGKFVRSLKRDTLICHSDQALLVEAYKIYARRIEGYYGKKVDKTE